MIKNYIKTAFVNLKKHKSFSFINILGLSIGIAGTILITAYVFHELSYDRFHDKADRIYRLRSDLKISGNHLDIPKSSPPMSEYMASNYPEVLSAVRFRKLDRIPVRFKENLYYEDRLFFADNTVFEVFSFPLVRGDPQSALKTAYSVVITKQMAEKYFGNQDPLGQVINLNNVYDMTVTGVTENVPQNSHLIFDMLCSFETYAVNNKRDMSNWLSINNYTYILLQEGSDHELLEQKFPEMIINQAGNILKYVKGEYILTLQPITRIHLHSNLMQEVSGNSSIAYVYIFTAIALFILLIACINFMNLSTARSANRAQEVGMRKVLGADRGKIIRQFLTESIIYSFISLIIALLLTELALPLFKSLTGIELTFEYTRTLWIIPSLGGLALVVGLFAGSYPAFFLSAFQPVRVLKKMHKTGSSGTRFRSVLVIVQFTISVALIIGTIVVFNQLNFMKNTRLGFQKEQIITVPISDNSTLSSLRPIKEELLSYSSILNVAASSQVPGQTIFVNPFIPEGFSLDEMQYMGELYVDHDFIPSLGIEMAAGRNFDPNLQTDRQEAVIINETAAETFGWADPIGKTIEDISSSQQLSQKTVIGVVKDFHYESLHKKIEPLYIGYTSHNLNSLSIRISPENVSSTLSFLREKMNEFDPQRPFEYTFLDDSFDAQYRAEEKLSQIFTSFSILAVFIACLGLFGLASFTSEQRTKEIGIRRVLGASIKGIITLLSKQFAKWVLIANAIAWPIAYFALKAWLQGFAYRTNIAWFNFVFAAAISIFIALFTVSLQALRAATANPADSLRNE